MKANTKQLVRFIPLSQAWPRLMLALIIVLLAGIGGGMWQREILAAQKFETPALRAHILENSERKRDADLAAAKLARADGDRLREAAIAAHRSRTDPARVDEVISRFQELSGNADATPITTEFLRLLGKDPDAALAYIEGQKAAILASMDADRDRIRVKRAPLLSAADLLVTKGDTAAARTAYRELLQRDPAWPAALSAFAWFLYDQSVQNLAHRTLVAALADAEEAHTLATRLHAAAPADAKARRLLYATHTQMGDVLLQRGQPGDAAKVEQHATRSLELAEKLLADNPGSAQAVRDVPLSLDRLGNFLAERARPGDAAKALGHYTRSLALRERLLADNPGSAQAVRDVSVSLEKLGGFLAQRAQPGDADQALGHYTRCNELLEKLLADNPGTAQAVRDVSVSLERLGDFLARRAQPGDAEKALGHFTRSLDLREKLLAANPGSAEAVRDVSVSLDRLGDFLAQRAQPGDADKALGHYTRSLAVREKLLAANPGSAQAVRDVSVSLNRLGDFLAQRAQPGDVEKALGYFTRDLALSEKLLADNPGSAEAVRDVVVSHYKMAGFATKRGDEKEAVRHYRAIYDLLKPCLERGMTFDPPIVKLYETLKAEFAK